MTKNNPACLILAIPTYRLALTKDLGDERVFAAMGATGSIEALNAAGCWWGPRPNLEENESFRQIIPYVVLRCGDQYLTYTRGGAGGEARLHEKISMGFGGHVDLPDAQTDERGLFDLEACLTISVQRELDEEMPGLTVTGRSWVGLLADNTDAVGRVHVGLLGIWDVAEVPTASGEDAVAEVTAMNVDELKAAHARLEGWSQILIDNLDKI